MSTRRKRELVTGVCLLAGVVALGTIATLLDERAAAHVAPQSSWTVV